jgi:hypothetical protein
MPAHATRPAAAPTRSCRVSFMAPGWRHEVTGF